MRRYMADEQQDASPLKLLLTVEEAAAALGLGRTFVYSLIASGRIFSVKVGGARRIPIAALHEFVQRLIEF